VGVESLPLETRSLLLRRLVLEDAAVMLSLSNEATTRTWLPSQVYRDHAHAISALEFLISQYEAPGHPRFGAYVLAIEHRIDRALLGHVGFSPLNGEVEIGFSIAENRRGFGLATEAIVRASSWALQTFELDKILGITSVANVASRRTLERARFAYEGDKSVRFQGAEQEVSVYAIARNAETKSAG
jgi:ribosomal-protein-alanine N-acetyltransferase